MRRRPVRGWSALLLALLPAGCGEPAPRREAPVRLPVDVFADTGRTQRLPVVPPAGGGRDPVAVWLARVEPAEPGPIAVPLPEPTPGTPAGGFPGPPALEVDPGLKPPILRTPGRLVVPPRIRRGWVDVDVRVAEDGSVSDARWAGGGDSALAAAAIRCALDMRFFPALQAGRPVAVWCRQRFDFQAR